MTAKLDYCPPVYPDAHNQILGIFASVIAIGSTVVILCCAVHLRIQMQIWSYDSCGTAAYRISQQLNFVPIYFAVPISALLIAHKARSCIILCRAALLGVIAGWATCVLM